MIVAVPEDHGTPPRLRQRLHPTLRAPKRRGKVKLALTPPYEPLWRFRWRCTDCGATGTQHYSCERSAVTAGGFVHACTSGQRT